MIAARPTERRPISQELGIPPAELGLWIFLATVAMLFAAFFSSYLIRRASSDWAPIALPSLLWVNTGILLASSGTLERARAVARRSSPRSWMLVTLTLGIGFVAGQMAAWGLLRSEGIHLPSSPHSAFFYILTGIHALHLTGGLSLLAWGTVHPYRTSPRGADPLRLCATYWHFMGGLWVLVFLVLAAA